MYFVRTIINMLVMSCHWNYRIHKIYVLYQLLPAPAARGLGREELAAAAVTKVQLSSCSGSAQPGNSPSPYSALPYVFTAPLGWHL